MEKGSRKCGNCIYYNGITMKGGLAACDHHQVLVPYGGAVCLDYVYCDNPEKDWENKGLIVLRLRQLLVTTRAGAGIREISLTQDHGWIEIEWNNGTVQKVNVEAESGLQIIKDVLLAIS